MDESRFLIVGNPSDRVSRPSSSIADRIENCKISVFLGSRHDRGHALIDLELHLEKSWTDDVDRRRESGIPEKIKFGTKPDFTQQKLYCNVLSTQASTPVG